jgi:FkbM family methyltransferase
VDHYAAGTAARLAELTADPAMSGLWRSLRTYHGDPQHKAALDALYRSFVGAGDLVFDIGAHVGDRTGSLRRLGARVVAVEPQPLCARALRALFNDDDRVAVVEAACADRPGRIGMHLNSANPTVSTASADFVRAARGASGWQEQVWDTRIEVRATSLDSLITEYGLPAFVKIDVEGFEDVVLRGLASALPALSFEFTTIRREVALRCLDRLARLGPYRFNLSLGESHALADRWVSAVAMAANLRALPHSANSADIYCISCT